MDEKLTVPDNEEPIAIISGGLSNTVQLENMLERSEHAGRYNVPTFLRLVQLLNILLAEVAKGASIFPYSFKLVHPENMLDKVVALEKSN
jgi:hypothetical protein